MVTTVFITGATGYIGGSVFNELLQHPDKFEVTALVRTQARVAEITALGKNTKAVVGNYEDGLYNLTDAAKEYDAIIHIGESADHLESAKAILDGLSQRDPSKKPAVYIHTSGTGVLSDKAQGNAEDTKIYHDNDQADIDTLDENQPHRKIDIFIRDTAKTLSGKAKTAIIIPPNIYGIGTGPVNKISIQTPALIRFAIKHRFAPAVGKGINWWNNVHVRDLARGYLILLEELSKEDKDGWNGYWFAETGEHQWKDVYDAVGKALYSRNLIDSPTPKNPGKELGLKSDAAALLGGKDAYDAWGGNSRGAADRLHALGWIKEEKEDVVASVEGEVAAILKGGEK